MPGLSDTAPSGATGITWFDRPTSARYGAGPGVRFTTVPRIILEVSAPLSKRVPVLGP